MAIKKQRSAGIDLLKIFCMMGVIILHYNNTSIGKAFSYAPIFSTKSYVLYFLKAVFISAVDIFVLISGYFMCNSTKVDAKKPIRLLIQVIVFRELIYIVKTLTLGGVLRGSTLVKFLLPQSWFAVLYVALYLLAPFINRMLTSLSDKSCKLFIGIAFVVLSVWPWCVDTLQSLTEINFDGLGSVGMYGSQSGYTIVNFVLMYCIGACLRRFDHKQSIWLDIVGVLVSWLFIFISSYHCTALQINNQWTYSYGSPIVIANAVFLFRLFKRIPIKSNPVISSMATATFSVYLLNSTIIADFLDTKKYVQSNGWVMLGHIAFTCVLIFLISYAAQLLYDLITKPIYKLTDKLLPFNTIISAEKAE